ncbi:LysR family transcriptional regulator [Kitasatospora sp. McL0602]|uniref:LysR family transcriptional regulator n=1 Tax=Kitasatospora sp. McL0602 TaxID=3439530 RepID=UPI003F88A753
MDVDTRLLRYFVAVAQEGTLSRAAQRLFVSQPALTRQVRQLEAVLGVTLFTRSRTGMTLTDAGRALLARAPAVLADWEHAARDARSAASRAARVLRVGFMDAGAAQAAPSIVAEFGRRRPGWRIDMRQAAWSDPTGGLAEGEADVALVRLPVPGQAALRMELLFTEPRWVVLPQTHPLAERPVIAFQDLWDEPFVAAPAQAQAWRNHWLAADERGGTPVRIGAVTDQPDDWLSAIANGYGIALAPESAARFYARPGITYRPVTGVSPSQVAVAWTPTEAADPVVRDFVQCCLDHHPQRDQLAGTPD